ncbi:MAG TPA: DUF5916 domain-containing protein, partial [Candidatus Edwardsbacteria bacterium]|nr:DUF5916 domain-containing protein [Candidatus Edwardsbacteria bacterium]
MKCSVRLAIIIIAATQLAAHPATAQARPPAKALEVHSTAVAPKIDGYIEELWQQADSSDGFVQASPYEGAAPTERSVVYALQDRENLYLAFRFHSRAHPPVANYTKDEDGVIVGIDPFGSKTNAYFFEVFGSRLIYDGMMFDDGRTTDGTWEGVWSRGVKLYPDHIDFEIRIPFKSIRYKQGLGEWGFQVRRHQAANLEDDSWTPVSQKDGDLVSRWGVLCGVAPGSSGYHFELFPEGFVRYDKFTGEQDKLRPKASINLKWDVTPQAALNATAYPDFAQIESDPTSVNLSRYPTYLQEQRPFFVEGQEVFRLSNFGDGWFNPLNICYSRRIGKSIDGGSVPIIGGVQLTQKSEAWNMGAMAAFTDSYDDPDQGIREPQRKFGALRIRHRLLQNSDIGLLASGTAASGGGYDYAAGADGVWRRGANQLIVQGAISDRDGKRGWATSSGFKGFAGPLLTMAAFEASADSFDVRDIGYLPWAGRQRAMLLSGPFWTFTGGPLRNLYAAPGISLTREPGSPHWSTIGVVMLNPTFRRTGGCNLEFDLGKNYEADTNYLYRSLNFNFWSMLMGNNINGGCTYNYGYNYARGFLAYQGNDWLNVSYSIVPPLSVTLNANLWQEWDQDQKPLAMWPLLRPSVNYRITPDMTLTAFDELFYYAPGIHATLATLQTNRLGMLFSWNFAPKSWLYVALNDYQETDGNGTMR